MLFSKPVIPLATLLLAAQLASASLIVREPGKISGEPTPAFVSAPAIPKEMYEGLTKSVTTPSTTKQSTTTAAASRRDVDTATDYVSTSESSPISLSSTPSPTPEEIVFDDQDSTEDDDDVQDEMCDDNDHGRKVKRAQVESKTPPKPNAGGHLSNGLWWKRTPVRGNAKSVKQVEQAPYPVPQNATNNAGQQQGYVTGTASLPAASGVPERRSGPAGSWWKRAPVRNNAKQDTYAGQTPPYQNGTSGAGQQQGYSSGTASVPAPSGAPVKRAGGAGSGYGGYNGGNAGNGTGPYQSKTQGSNPTATPPAWASSAAPPYATGSSGNPNNGRGRTGKVRREPYGNDAAL